MPFGRLETEDERQVREQWEALEVRIRQRDGLQAGLPWALMDAKLRGEPPPDPDKEWERRMQIWRTEWRQRKALYARLLSVIEQIIETKQPSLPPSIETWQSYD